MVKSANDVGALVADLKAKGTPDAEIAWKTALACVGWSYVFGARGEYCDPSNRRSRARDDHPTIKSKCKNFKGKDSVPAGCVGCQYFVGTAKSDESKHEGRTRFFDCRGFTYWILMTVYGFTLRGAGATSQWDTASNWKSKGSISTMPKDTLCCLFVRKGSKMEHTGFGLNNETVECSVGVQHFTSRKAKWTHWAVPVCIEGTITPTPTPTPTPSEKPTLKRGATGEYVIELQTKLASLGYDIGSYGIDGKFGKCTESAVKLFQANNGLVVDGVVGANTWGKLDGTEPKEKTYSVTIKGLTYDKALTISKSYANSVITEE